MPRPRLLSIALAAAALCLTAAPASAACPDENTVPTAANLAQVEAATICLLNERRAASGIGPLGLDGFLATAAERYSQRMVSERFFDHRAPDGTDLVKRLLSSGYLLNLADWLVGENLAYGTGDRGTPKAIVQSWIDSPTHREIIFKDVFRAAGIGVAIGTPSGHPGGATYTANFGARVRTAAPAPAAQTTQAPSTTRRTARRRKALRSCRLRRKTMTRRQARRCRARAMRLR